MQFLARRSEEFLLPQSEFTPHRFACGLTPLAHRRTFPSESLTLKGGVKKSGQARTSVSKGSCALALMAVLLLFSVFREIPARINP